MSEITTHKFQIPNKSQISIAKTCTDSFLQLGILNMFVIWYLLFDRLRPAVIFPPWSFPAGIFAAIFGRAPVLGRNIVERIGRFHGADRTEIERSPLEFVVTAVVDLTTIRFALPFFDQVLKFVRDRQEIVHGWWSLIECSSAGG